MTKTTEDVSRFIELRAKGYSFDKIAEETGISKPVLLKWQSEYSRQLKEAKYYEIENIVNQYNIMRLQRFEGVSRLLASAYKELDKRSSTDALQEMETGKLFQLVQALEERLEKDTGKELLAVNKDKHEELMAILNEEYLEVD